MISKIKLAFFPKKIKVRETVDLDEILITNYQT